MIQINDPILSWHVKVDDADDFVSTRERYVGTYTGRKKIAVRIQLWNNKSGIEDVNDLKDFDVKIFFQDLEDSSLLNYISTEDKEGNLMRMENLGKFLLLKFPVDTTLEGKANNGITNESKKNCVEFKIIFQAPENVHLKEGDLKNLHLEVI